MIIRLILLSILSLQAFSYSRIAIIGSEFDRENPEQSSAICLEKTEQKYTFSYCYFGGNHLHQSVIIKEVQIKYINIHDPIILEVLAAVDKVDMQYSEDLSKQSVWQRFLHQDTYYGYALLATAIKHAAYRGWNFMDIAVGENRKFLKKDIFVFQLEFSLDELRERLLSP